MNKTKKTSSTFFQFTFCLILVIIFNVSCNSDYKQGKDENLKVTSSLNKKSCQCNCATNYLNCEQCVGEFLGGQLSRTFNIDWLSCVTPGGSSFPGTSSTITFCIKDNGKCDELCAILNNPPSQLVCLGNPSCFNATIHCNPNGGYSITYHDGGIDWNLTVSVIEDPKFVVTCTDLTTGATYNCFGDLY